MSLDGLLSWIAAVAIFLAFFRGVRAAREINRIYHDDDTSLILRTLRDGTFVKVFAAGWFGTITTLAIFGIVLPFLRPISLIIAILVLDLPSLYLWMIRTIRGEAVGSLSLPILERLRRLRSRR